MQYLREISAAKETVFETQHRPVLSNEDLLTLCSLNSRLRTIFANAALAGLVSSVFLRIVLARYRILVRSWAIDLAAPATVMNYYLVTEVTGFRNGRLRNLGVFANKDDQSEYDQKRSRLLGKYSRKFYTNSQFWH